MHSVRPISSSRSGLLHENFIQQGFKFPVMKSDLIKLIDSNEAFQWVETRALRGAFWAGWSESEWSEQKFNLSDKEIQNLFVQVLEFTCNLSKHAICKLSETGNGGKIEKSFKCNKVSLEKAKLSVLSSSSPSTKSISIWKSILQRKRKSPSKLEYFFHTLASALFPLFEHQMHAWV